MGGDRLRPLWDFADLDTTERRFRALAEEETSAAGRAEVLTQLARVEGLRGSFAEADRLLDEARVLAGSEPIVDTRIDLERGRVRRSSGEVEESLPLFESAFAGALAAGEWFIAADAAHMAALATDRDVMLAWTRRGIELAESEDEARYWLGPLLNNQGWAYYEAGEYEAALDSFSQALHARRRAGDESTIALARYAVGKTFRALDRAGEAVALLEPAVAWSESQGAPDGWFHEELAEAYAALGRDADAREQAKLALPLLMEADPAFADQAERVARLRALAGDL